MKKLIVLGVSIVSAALITTGVLAYNASQNVQPIQEQTSKVEETPVEPQPEVTPVETEVQETQPVERPVVETEPEPEPTQGQTLTDAQAIVRDFAQSKGWPQRLVDAQTGCIGRFVTSLYKEGRDHQYILNWVTSSFVTGYQYDGGLKRVYFDSLGTCRTLIYPGDLNVQNLH